MIYKNNLTSVKKNNSVKKKIALLNLLIIIQDLINTTKQF